jgi:adenylate cyclase
MARALDLLSECGSERGVRDVEDWLRTTDSSALVRLALERHFPDYLVENIVSGQLGRQPTKRQTVTVLFCDIRNYTGLAEGTDPEAVVEMLNEWFAEVTRAVRQHGGVVDKFMGDGVMVLFGVPEPREGSAADAVRTALALRDGLAALNLRNRALGGREIRVGVGIHTGEAVVGFIGSHLRQSYTAIGDVVNTASRLESATKEHGWDILISQETLDAQEPFRVAETEFLGKIKVKGKQREVAVYKVLGPRDPAPPAD